MWKKGAAATSIALMAVVATICGCSDLRDGYAAAAQQIVADVGAPQLLEDAIRLTRRPASDGTYAVDSWPPSFREFRPLRVVPHMFGVLIVTEAAEDYERGVYIITDPAGLPPDEGSGVRVEAIEDRVFWVEQDIRRPVRQSRR